MTQVLVVPDLRDYFRDQLAEVRRRQRLEVRKETEKYLLDLLAEGATLEEPLAFVLQRAREARGSDRIALLKRMGDEALYTAGFFSDSLSGGLVGPDYYASMGRQAYDALAEMTRYAVFAELAAKFNRLLEVLSELYEATLGATDDGLLKLYERYLRTGSERIRWQLQINGRGPRGLDT